MRDLYKRPLCEILDMTDSDAILTSLANGFKQDPNETIIDKGSNHNSPLSRKIDPTVDPGQGYN